MDSDVAVFVRVRPLLSTERSIHLPGLVLGSTSPQQTSVVALESSSPIGGFNGVLGQESDNHAVFERSFAPRVATVLRGGTASLFCYGYTGSGKTHTVVGYGGEFGMYHLAAERLLRELQDAGHNNLFLRVTSCELYGDRVLDLLGPEKIECSLCVDEAGQLQVLGPSISTELEGSAGLLDDPESLIPKKCMRSALITHSCGLKAISVYSARDLEKIGQTCLQQRATGSSTTHHQSSRSHAILRMEVMSKEVLAAREALSEALAAIPACKNAVDNVKTGAIPLLFDFDMTPAEGTKLVEGDICFGWFGSDLVVWGKIWEYVEPRRFWDIEQMGKDPASGERTYALRGMGDTMRTIKDWTQRLDATTLYQSHILVKRYADKPELWEAKRQEVRAVYELVEGQLKQAEANVELARTNMKLMLEASPAVIGGSLLLVDLAGADYDHRSGSEQKESAAINKSLLALKECFRALANVSGQRPKFRDSKLTRLLEDSLAPSESSQRLNRESVSVLIVNISPAANMEKMTLNTLRYGQMYAGNANKVPGTVGNRGYAGKPTAKTRLADPAVKAAPCLKKEKADQKSAEEQPMEDSKIRAELFQLYEEYCPEKSVEDVESILAKFVGREKDLLAMARQKYVKKATRAH